MINVMPHQPLLQRSKEKFNRLKPLIMNVRPIKIQKQPPNLLKWFQLFRPLKLLF